MAEAGLEGVVSMRVTHAYPDGLAPYYTVTGPARQAACPATPRSGAAWDLVKAAAMEAIAATGATATHHHAVGRDHRPAYDRQRPDVVRGRLRRGQGPRWTRPV